MNYKEWFRKYWVFPVAALVAIWYLSSKWKLQNDLRERGKCTVGVVKSELKFTSSQYFNYIEYEVEDSLYILSSKKVAKVGSHIPILYDSVNPSRASRIKNCSEDEIKNIKIDFFVQNLW
ncbi:MAG: hypothetical protein WDA08_02095 [Weeksellaceae bacterium]